MLPCVEKVTPSSHELRLSKEPKEYQNHKTTEDTSLVKIHGAQFFVLLTNYTANFTWATIVSIDISGFYSFTSFIGGLSTVNDILVGPIILIGMREGTFHPLSFLNQIFVS